MASATEILVHISAPSRASDDARYRREVQGYLNFEAETRLEIRLDREEEQNTIHSSFLNSESGESDYGDVDLSSIKTPGRIPGTSAHIDCVRTPANCLLNNAPSISAKACETPVLRRSQSDSWEPPPSVVPDSQPSLPHLKRSIRLSSSFTDLPSPKRRCLSSPPRAKPAIPLQDSPLSETPNPQPSSPSLPRVKPATLIPISPLSEVPKSQPPSPSPSLPPFPHLVRSPPPFPDDVPFKTHITPCLALLHEHLDLQLIYIDLQLHPRCGP